MNTMKSEQAVAVILDGRTVFHFLASSPGPPMDRQWQSNVWAWQWEERKVFRLFFFLLPTYTIHWKGLGTRLFHFPRTISLVSCGAF